MKNVNVCVYAKNNGNIVLVVREQLPEFEASAFFFLAQHSTSLDFRSFAGTEA